MGKHKKRSKEQKRHYSLAMKKAWRRRKKKAMLGLTEEKFENNSYPTGPEFMNPLPQYEAPLPEVPVPTETPKRKDMLTLFILFFPTIVIGIMPYIGLAPGFQNAVLRAASQVMIMLLQFVCIKNFIDDYYDK